MNLKELGDILIKPGVEGRKNESEIFNFKHLECLIKKTTIKQTDPTAIYSFIFK